MVRIYGVKTLLCGTLLPSPIIGEMAPELLQAVLDRGTSWASASYDHVLWQDRLQGLGEAGITNEIERAIASYVKALKIFLKGRPLDGRRPTPAWWCRIGKDFSVAIPRGVPVPAKLGADL